MQKFKANDHFKKNWIGYLIAVFILLNWNKFKMIFADNKSTAKTNDDILDKVKDDLYDMGYVWETHDGGNMKINFEAAGAELYNAMSGWFTDKSVLRYYLTKGEETYVGKDPTDDQLKYKAACLILGYGKRTLKGVVPVISDYLPQPELTLPFAVSAELDFLDFSLKSDINEFFKPLNIRV